MVVPSKFSSAAGLVLALFLGACESRVMEPADQASSDPMIIAHRGASGDRPEHTLEAYQLAIEQGADFIEPDLVSTRDGVLIARHENELSTSTNVSDIPAFADRSTTKTVDGKLVHGWFSEDFTLAEIKQLRARERIPEIRPANMEFDDEFAIPTFAEVIQLASDAGQDVGVYPETKHPTYFEHEGVHLDGQTIGLNLGELMVSDLVANNFVDAARVRLQSFEVANLRELKHRIMPKAGVDLPLIQLIGDLDRAPYDIRFHFARDEDRAQLYGDLLAPWIKASGQVPTYAGLLQPSVLRAIATDYASGLGPAKQHVLPVTGSPPTLTGAPAGFVGVARDLDLEIHVYTLRAEPLFIPRATDGSIRSLQSEYQDLVRAGVTGVFTDHPGMLASTRSQR